MREMVNKLAFMQHFNGDGWAFDDLSETMSSGDEIRRPFRAKIWNTLINILIVSDVSLWNTIGEIKTCTFAKMLDLIWYI